MRKRPATAIEFLLQRMVVVGQTWWQLDWRTAVINQLLMRYSCDQIAGADGWFQKAMFITIFKTDNIAIPRSLYCRAPSVTDMELDAVGREFKVYHWQRILWQRLNGVALDTISFKVVV